METHRHRCRAAATAWLVVCVLVGGVAGASAEKLNKKKLARAFAQFGKGSESAQSGALDDAEREYRAALRDDPDEPYWYQALGVVLDKEGKSQEALEAYSRAAQLSPYDVGLQAKRDRTEARLAGGPAGGEAATETPPRVDLPKGTSPPRAIYQPDPAFSEKARVLKYSGTVLLVILVDAEGNVVHVRDARPIGLGLDERAIDVVRTWKFQPAMRNGVPVPIEVGVEVSFRLR